MTPIDRYVDAFAAELRVDHRTRARVVSEVRDHLDDAVAHRLELGDDPERAIDAALTAFGPHASLARRFNIAAGTRAMRRAPTVVFGAGLAVVVGLLVAATANSRRTAPSNASVPNQIAFFVATVAFEIAVVAGLCATSRVASLWRTSEASAADREYVRGSSVLSIAALAVAAVGWGTTMLLALSERGSANRAAVVVGMTIMIGGAIAAGAVIARLDVNRAEDAAAPTHRNDGPLAWTEHAIALVRRRPVGSCVAIAIAAAAGAMSHAETTLSGALPWGIGQALAVVIAFVALGPRLELRASRTVRRT